MSRLKIWAQHPRTSAVTAAEKGDEGVGGVKKAKKTNKTKRQHLRHQLRSVSFVQARPTDGRLDYRGRLPPRRAACTVRLVFDEM